MNVEKKFSLPMQVMICSMLLLQIIFIFVMPEKDNAGNLNLNFSEGSGCLIGYMMFIIAVVFFAWNIIIMVNGKKQIAREVDTDRKELVFMSSIYVRYITLFIVSFVGIIFCAWERNLYFLLFTIVSVIWQIIIFPTKGRIVKSLFGQNNVVIVEEFVKPQQTMQPQQNEN